jgi:gliding motility-associated-like protein
MTGYSQVDADFSADVTSGCDILTVHFTNTSTGTDLEYFWDFGNGNTSTNFEPTTIYNTPGSYDVMLAVNDGVNYDTLTIENYINYYNGPTADFTHLSDTLGCIPLTVSFQDLSAAGDGAITGWSWDFGDGDSSEDPDPEHTYVNSGIYAVSLQITDANNCNDIKIVNNYINATPKPVANFITDQSITCNDFLEVNFTSVSTGYGAISHEWDFGDGGTSSEENPTHTYNGLGTYTVKLTISDENECTDSVIKEDYIQLIEIAAEFEIESDTICPNQNIPIINNSEGVSSYIWNFGDGTILLDENPEYFYTDSGSYIISLAVYSEEECFAVTSDTVYVEYIKANFITDTAYSCEVPFTIQYTNNSENAVAYEWHFGNNNSSVLENPQNTYELTGQLENNDEAFYTDTLYAISANGCINKYHPPTSNVSIVLPRAKFTPNDVDYENPSELTGCAPLNINFINTSTFNSPYETIESYAWDFGDGETSDETDVSKTYTDTNQYVVSLVLTTTYSCVDTFLTTVKVGNPQTAEFELLSASTTCASDSVALSDLSTDANYVNGWQWLFGDGATSNLQNPYHFFSDTGYMVVSLIAYHNGCPSDTTKKDSLLKILGPLGTFETEIDCNQPFDYNFIGNLNDITSFSWDFGDGTTNTTDTTIVHTYSTTDDFQVTLTAENTNTGCSFQFSDVIRVRNPQASFTQSNELGCPFLNVSFDPRSSTDYTEFDYNGETGSFLWYFGDTPQRRFTEDTVVNHIFTNRGEFPVELIVKSENGCLDTARSKVKIYQPVASFITDTTVGCTPVTIEFTNTTQTDTIISSYQWFFGDDNFSNQENVSHTFEDIGLFTIQLKATDILGCEDTVVVEDLINSSRPIPDFTTPDLFLCENDTIVFLSTSVGTIESWQWDFGDGNASQDENPQHAYSDSGFFSVSLYAVDVFGCDSTKTKSDYIHVQAKPVANFTADDTTGACWPATIRFTDESDSDYIQSWQWDFGDNSSGSTVQNPTKIYAEPGSFDVALQVETTYGCKDTLIKENYINIIGAYAEIVAADTSCPNVPVEFSVGNQENVMTFNWIFEDGSSDNNEETSYIFDSFGEQYTTLLLYSFDESCPPKQLIDTIYIHEINAGFQPDEIAGCVPFTIDLTDTSLNASSWSWSYGDGSTDNGNNVSHTYTEDGSYIIQEFIENEFECLDTAELEITVYPLPFITTSSDTLICTEDTAFIRVTGGNSYAWSPSFLMTDANSNNPGAFPANTTLFTVIGTDLNGCINSDSILITVQQKPIITEIIQDTTVVIGEQVQLYANYLGGKTFYWSPAEVIEYPDSLLISVIITDDIEYQFTVIDSNECFEITEDVLITVREVYSVDLPKAFTPNNDGNNDIIYVRGWGVFELVEFRIYNRFGKEVFVSNDITQGWDGNFEGVEQPAGTYGYTVIIKSYDDKLREKVGSFMLLR